MMRNIALKVEQGHRINEAEALWLFKHAPLNELGRLANRVNLRKNGKAVFYNINRHINPTNICSLSCKFCAYSKKIGEEGGYAYEIDEMITKAGEAIAQGATELHMVGGLHPRWNFQRYVDMIAAMHKAYPTVHLKAFTAVELDWMARKARKTIQEVMTELRAAGLGSFPGGGAEIFHPEIRDQICDTKVSGDQWIDTHRTAHRLGMRSNCTMLYGHIESFEHRVDHMRRLRDLQDETAGFNVFIPLAFQPFQNEMGVNRYTFGADDLRTIAVARLYLDNFRHIKSYWVMLGQDVAQLALQFGANDLDGTVLEEKISRAAGGRAGMIMTRSNLESLIRRSGRIPVERTTLYEPVHESDRCHMAPVTGESVSDDITDSLHSLEGGGTLAPSNLWKVAKEAPLHLVTAALDASGKLPKEGQTLTESLTIRVDMQTNSESVAIQVRKLNSESKKISDGEPSIISIDASSLTGPIDLTPILEACRLASPQSQLVLHGIKSLFVAAESLGIRISEYMAKLHSAGLNTIEESLVDANLKPDDKWMIFYCAQSADISVIPLLSLGALGSDLDWSRWADEIAEVRSRLTTNKTVFAVNLCVKADALIMPSEYFKAMALTRLCLPETVQIWTPVFGIPVLSPQRGLGADNSQHPAMKMVSTLLAFGSSSLGIIPSNEISTERLLEDVRASGTQPRLTCVRLNEMNLDTSIANQLSNLRHVPQVTAVS